MCIGMTKVLGHLKIGFDRDKNMNFNLTTQEFMKKFEQILHLEISTSYRAHISALAKKIHLWFGLQVEVQFFSLSSWHGPKKQQYYLKVGIR